ncbi:hypothetical protein ACFO4E_01570 [Nocardiopsis mangrovi]|uniref:Uncharacterized protein n=1 Tax=Nocardiopsis mangrovi TaxID=1179818 RepID=A0ABV9DNN7_9ACTN
MSTAVGSAGASPSPGRGTGTRGRARERGASVVEYGAVVALVALIMGGLATTTDIPGYDRDYARHFTVFNGEWGRGDCGDSNGGNEVDDGEQERLNELVGQAHRSGLQVRFWGGPDGRPRNPGDPGEFYACDTGIFPGRQGCENEARQDAWEAQMEAGVDFCNTNHLTQSAEWLRSCGGEF